MVGFSHAIYIDESGIGARQFNINRLFASVAVAVPFDMKNQFDTDLARIRAVHCQPGAKELKGSGMPHDLLSTSTIASVARDLAASLNQAVAHTWVVVSTRGVNAPPGFSTSPLVKDIVRQLLFERLNGFLVAGYCPHDNFLLIWDITEQQELNDFSQSVASFKNAYTGGALSPRLAPAILGGLSHDWSGLQAADVIANFALHKVGMSRPLPGANPQKEAAFDQYFLPILQRDIYGNRVGWKVW